VRGIESKEESIPEFLQNPLETHLALEIKIIDDQVAECTGAMKGKHARSFLRRPVYSANGCGPHRFLCPWKDCNSLVGYRRITNQEQSDRGVPQIHIFILF
jgi:hypothetical protein